MARVIERPREGDDRASPLADPGARLQAVVLDAAIPAAPHLLLMPLGVVWGSADWVHAALWLGWIAMVVAFGVNLVLLARHGQTIGKRLVGIRIVRTDGSPASFARLFWLRMVVSGAIEIVPLIGSLYGLADALLIFGAERRTLHDRIADTIVIDLRVPLGIGATVEVFA